jgi:DNA repair exonuclease SbcCD nuclease subunit
MDTFILMGDMGSGENDQFVVSERMNEKIKELGRKDIFVCGLGDNIYEDGCYSVNDKQFITKFEKPYEKISDDVKFYMCLGNHDYGYNLGLEDNSQHQIDYGIVSQKNNKKWVMPAKYYTFKKKNSHFFVMDTNFEYMSDKEIKTQLNYLVKEINKSTKPWKILTGHHTLRSVGGHGNAELDILEKFFQELFSKCEIDLYMCGHDHNKQVIDTTIGGKNTTLIVCGTGGKKYHDFTNFKNVSHGELQFASSNLGYGLCECSKKLLTIQFYDESNNPEYTHTLNKP